MYNVELLNCSFELEFNSSNWVTIAMTTSASLTSVTVVPPHTVAASLLTSLVGLRYEVNC